MGIDLTQLIVLWPINYCQDPRTLNVIQTTITVLRVALNYCVKYTMVLNINVFYTSLFEISQMRCNNHKYFPLKNINTSVIVRIGNKLMRVNLL